MCATCNAKWRTKRSKLWSSFIIAGVIIFKLSAKSITPFKCDLSAWWFQSYWQKTEHRLNVTSTIVGYCQKIFLYHLSRSWWFTVLVSLFQPAESVPNDLKNSTEPHNDYFSTQFLLTFPVTGIHQVQIEVCLPIEFFSHSQLIVKDGKLLSTQVGSHEARLWQI